MSVLIKPVGSLKNYIGGKTEIAIDSGLTIREMMAEVGIPPEIVAMVLVNENSQPKDYRPFDGDIVKLVAIFGGG